VTNRKRQTTDEQTTLQRNSLGIGNIACGARAIPFNKDKINTCSILHRPIRGLLRYLWWTKMHISQRVWVGHLPAVNDNWTVRHFRQRFCRFKDDVVELDERGACFRNSLIRPGRVVIMPHYALGLFRLQYSNHILQLWSNYSTKMCKNK